MIKARARARGLGEVKVVHIGPEPASKGEMLHGEGPASLDAALTFHEVRHWIRSLDPKAAAPKAQLRMDEAGPPLEWVRDILPIYGVDECVDFLKSPHHIAPGTVVEMATCRYGCAIGSPRLLARVPEASAFLYPAGSPLAPEGIEEDGRPRPLAHVQQPPRRAAPAYRGAGGRDPRPNIGVTSREDELNCGACGYDRCREWPRRSSRAWPRSRCACRSCGGRRTASA